MSKAPDRTPPPVVRRGGRARTTTVFGHPKALFSLTFAEAWERFSFAGMQALLVLYMGRELLLPGHAEHVIGLGAFRALVTSVYGPLSTAGLASIVFGLYSGAVYLTPLLGGLIADRLLGRTRTIVVGALFLMAGHFLMAFEAPFLIALACLVLGVGGFKGNIATQVGELYAPDDLRRADAFQIYMIGIAIAAIVAPLVCGTLGQRVNWSWGFLAAGVGMAVGLVTYLAAARSAPESRTDPKKATPHRRLAPGERRTVLILLALLPPLALAAVGNEQMFNAYLVWGDRHLNLELMGNVLPVTWLVSVDAGIAVLAMGATVLFWRWWATWRREPDEIHKLIIGVAISATAPLLLAVASLQEVLTGHRIGLIWAVSFHVVNEIGVANFFPVGLALFSRAAPKAVAGLMIGVYYLHLFAANLVVGWLGVLLERMSAPAFWGLHAALVGGAALVLAVFSLIFARELAPTVDPETPGASVPLIA